MIDIDVALYAHPKILSSPSISQTVELDALLGVDGDNDVIGSLDAEADITGYLSGGLDVLSGQIDIDVDAQSSRVIGWSQLAKDTWSWYVEDRPDVPYQYIVRFISFAYYDTDYDPPLPLYTTSVAITDTVSVLAIPGVVIPDPPLPAPPAPPEDPGNFPMPTAGGVHVRAHRGVVVDMDTPTIVNGVPSS